MELQEYRDSLIDRAAAFSESFAARVQDARGAHVPAARFELELDVDL